MRWNRWISLSVRALLGTAFLPVTTSLLAADDTPLTAPAGASPDERDEAALRLVNRDTPEAHQEIKTLLQNNAAPAVQISIARALAQCSSPDSQLIPTLGKLLGPNPTLTDAAANALANYRQNPDAFDDLRQFINGAGNPNQSRIKAVLAVGNMVEPEITHAEFLVNLLGQRDQNDAIKIAATEALTNLTGATEPGRDIGKWQQWWAANRNKTPDQFKAMLLSNRVAQFNQLRQRNARLASSIEERLRAIYFATPAAGRDAVVLGYLDDAAPDIRIAAIGLVADNDADRGTKLPVIIKLTKMISDSDVVVRLSVAEFIYKPRGFDATIAGPLLDQLAIEKNAGVKQAIAKALGKLQDPQVVPKVVPALIAMLQDKQSDDVKAAANAFTNLGEKLHTSDPAKANQVSDVIRNILKPGQNPAISDDVRAACMNALAALRDPESFDTFMGCFNGGQVAVEIREAALDGLGNLGNTNADQVVANELNDPDPVISLKAAAALRTVATQNVEHLIFPKMINNATDTDTRAYLWQAMQHLFDDESPAQLKQWATRFDKDPEKKLITLQKLGKALYKAADADKAAGNLQQSATDSDDAALNEQDIADATLAVRQPGQTDPTPDQIADAIKHSTLALNYWRQPSKAAPGIDDRLLTLVGQILNYKLMAANWTDAADFAAAQLAINPKYAEAVGPPIRDKIDALKAAHPSDAQKLIEAALAMNPPLPEQVLKDIRDMQNELKQAPPPP